MSATLLAACGGGEGDGSLAASSVTPPKTAATTTTTTPPIAMTPPVIIEYYGDSTIWGGMPGGSQYVNNPPAVLQADLRAACGFEVDVVNKAVSGAMSSQLLQGTGPYGDAAWGVRMAASRAQIIIPGGYGINDSWYGDVAAYKQNMADLIRIAQQAGKVVVAETSNPIVPNDVVTPARATVLFHMVQALFDVSAASGIPAVDNYTRFAFSQNPAQYFVDGIHPTEATSIDKAGHVADTLKAIICP